MAMRFKTRKRLALLVLFFGMPLYVIVAVNLVALVPPLPKLVELAMFIFLGVAWIFPLKPLFLGIAREDPEAGGGAGAGAEPGPGQTQKAPR